MEDDESNSLPKSKVILLGKEQRHYDLCNLPKRSRKSRSFCRRPSIEPREEVEQLCYPSFAQASVEVEESSGLVGDDENPDGLNDRFVVREVDLLESYKLEVIRAKAFTVLDKTYTTAAIQDFSRSYEV